MSEFTSPRITEKRFLAIPPIALTANGTVNGLISISNTYRFKVGQCVLFKGPTYLKAKIQKIISKTQFIVINSSESITTKNKLDMSTFLIGHTVELQETKRPVIDLLEIQRQVYEEEPTVALRTHQVDWLGRSYDASNPMPVQLSDGSIDIGTVNAELAVQLSHLNDSPNVGDVADSVRIGGTQYEAEVTNTNRLKVDTIISPPSPNDNPKSAIMCANDVHVDYTWAEINGVRRITQILWSSALIATELNLTMAAVQRDYTYNGSDPYDLIDRNDSLVLVQ